MRRVLLVIVLVVAGAIGSAARAPRLTAQPVVPVRIDQKTFITVVDWQSGTRQGLLVSNNDDGELRLAENRIQGVFTSGAIEANFPFRSIGAVWRADVPAGTGLVLELRAGPTADQLGAWQPLAAGDARSQSDDGALALESVRFFLPDTKFFELRATFSTTVANASPVLSEISLTYFDTSAGPSRPTGLPPRVAPYGPNTRPPPPLV